MYTRFILRKIIRALLTLWILVTFTFVAMRITGDPALNMLGPDASPDAVETLRRIWGLDKPLLTQYQIYLANIAQGNFGDSYRDGRSAVEVVFERLPKSLQLNLSAFIIMVVLALPIGIIAALRHNTAIDRATMLLSVFGFAMPNFFLGILLILIFSMRLQWLPSGGSDSWQHMILPMITLVVSEVAILSRFVRSSMLEVINQPYIRTARMKGLHNRVVIWQHALPNALIPVVTVMGLRFVSYIGGSVITENVFAWPGVGRLTVQAVGNRDLAVVQLIVLLIGATMVTVNLSVDLLYSLLDPRIRVK
ncbi:MAG: ABC transporter permease [Anaerolineae bacterium]|nr:ABC transporter permease [Anaerolineae bacterium]